MSSATQGSNGTTLSGRVNKTTQKRRSWSTREEEVLIAALKELVAQGWKSDNGFRAGYLSKLEEAMRKDFPTTDLKGMPHINSKVTTWKKTYYSLWNILKTSGVGFNVDGKHMIDCDDEQWENFVRVDNSVSNYRKKSWPLLEDWKIIFGKDRATGDEAEDLMEASHEMYRKLDTSQPNADDDYRVSLEDLFENGEAGDNVSHTQVHEESVTAEKEVRGCGKKRRRSATFDDRFFEALHEINRGTETRLDTISSKMGYDYDISKARKEVFAQLSAIPGLSKMEKFELTDLLAKEVERLDVFSSLPDDAKEDYVHYLLALKHK
ncbi:uncharacterized protein LOC131014226 isoform X2 [Salvia miltiorrhiza]|uniref:uncharacterized protein LOC131014226 isoform X2 n=1 Tax=Salvia miltiorrhiza TaxID=226208 RepID=UPI0025AD18BA|nr:uncharacterized protein LOC131014226 isoform X2 [Salvia miltiorrhiza]